MKKLPLNTILQGDSTELLKKLPSQSIDMIFADPPYNLQLKGNLHRPDHSKVDGVTDAWDKFDTFGAYDAFSNDWLSEARRVLKKDGTIWVIGSYHNIFRIGSTLQNLGYWMLNDVVWRKSNPMPNFKGRRFTNAHETLIWCSRQQDSHYTFNYESLKAMNDDLQMRSDWEFPLCTGSERLKGEDGKKVHPTQKPESLLYRIIIATTNPGDVVLDPFFGTGTTGAVAKKLGRHYIGLERDSTYIKAAQERLTSIDSLSEASLLQLTPKRRETRIPFGLLLEYGYLNAGDILVDSKEDVHAQVRADGSLLVGQKTGSIHQVGAHIQNTPSCNGWQFWHVRRDNKKISIDAFREEIRSLLKKEVKASA